MSLTARMLIVLTSVGLISGGLLATVGLLTQERIELNRQKEIAKAIVQVIPGTTENQTLYEEKDLTIYGGSNAEGSQTGLAVLVSGKGFQDKITLMYGIDPGMTKIKRLAILEQKETPGLGAKITSKEAFLRFWDSKEASTPLSLHKPAVQSPEELGPSEVNTITGATISSEKVLGIVNLSLARIKDLTKEGKLKKEDSHGR